MNSTDGGRPGFVSTRWSLLLAAAERRAADPDPLAQDAWAELYRAYCYPVYTFVRRRGYPRPQAQDLTQDFFVHLLEKGTLGRVDSNKGRFRTFLLGALELFLAEAARREGARKRGGHSRFVFLDDPDWAESQYQLAAPAWETPEKLFDAQWASTLLGVVFTRLREEMIRADKERLFAALQGHVTGTEEASHQETAASLGLSLPAFKSHLHRLRGRYGALLREEIARTVADPANAEEELRYLRAALRPA
ncbi:MAG: sigma-70 family RNA polymerase sigma factor [Gluconacetobacter diazotrophicus]|nr:sigma-70 family RNA polymerase sigma factor [Gluconacetobacter diazotrophicus]